MFRATDTIRICTTNKVSKLRFCFVCSLVFNPTAFALPHIYSMINRNFWALELGMWFITKTRTKITGPSNFLTRFLIIIKWICKHVFIKTLPYTRHYNIKSTLILRHKSSFKRHSVSMFSHFKPLCDSIFALMGSNGNSMWYLVVIAFSLQC